MKIQIREISAQDIQKVCESGLPGENLLSDRVTLVCTDDEGHTAISYMQKQQLERLGIEYIQTHSWLEYSEVMDEYFMKLSQNDFYNDPIKNPPKTIDVRFIECKMGEDTEVWQNVETHQYYLRMLSGRERFARWMTCGSRMTNWEDRSIVRPNITFCNGCQTETVRYDDWNDTAAYDEPGGFNPNFRNKEK